MLDIPKDRKPPRAFRLSMMLGLVALLFVVLAYTRADASGLIGTLAGFSG